MTVEDLDSRRFWRDFEKRVKIVNTVLPFGKIKRYTGGSANESSIDVIELGVARDAVMALFSRYGFEEPKHWAELRGNHKYIETLESMLDGVRIGCRGDLVKGLQFVKSIRPQFCDAVSVCMVEGYEGLRNFHAKHMTFRKNADEYDEGAELPTREGDETPWPEHLR
jgi:hypothetical protein